MQLKNGVLISSINSMIVMLVAHFANQWKYRMRDINDLYVMINNPEMNWEEVNSLAEELKLNNMLYGLLREVKKIYNLTDLNILNEGQNLPLSTNIFFKYNFGVPQVVTSFPAEYLFSYRNYRKDFSILRSTNLSFYNTFNHLLFKNRAFYVNRKNRIKQWKPNRILILKKTNLKPALSEEKIKLSEKCFIQSRGTKNEQFILGDSIWSQSSYY